MKETHYHKNSAHADGGKKNITGQKLNFAPAEGASQRLNHSRPLRKRDDVDPYRGSNSEQQYNYATNGEGPRAMREGSWETLSRLRRFIVIPLCHPGFVD